MRLLLVLVFVALVPGLGVGAALILPLLVLSLGLVTGGYEGMPAVAAAVTETWRDTGVGIWHRVGELTRRG